MKYLFSFLLFCNSCFAYNIIPNGNLEANSNAFSIGFQYGLVPTCNTLFGTPGPDSWYVIRLSPDLVYGIPICNWDINTPYDGNAYMCLGQGNNVQGEVAGANLIDTLAVGCEYVFSFAYQSETFRGWQTTGSTLLIYFWPAGNWFQVSNITNDNGWIVFTVNFIATYPSTAIEVEAGYKSTDADGFWLERLTFLPVNISIFDAKIRSGIVSLSWVTQSETNNDHFEILRADSSRNFESIAQVWGAGNSSDANYYDVLDTHPAVGINYYRLRQVDYDGKQTDYVKTITVYYDPKRQRDNRYQVYAALHLSNELTRIQLQRK